MKKQILLILMLVLLAGGNVLWADDIFSLKGDVIAQTLESHYDYSHFDPNGDDLSFLWQEPEPTFTYNPNAAIFIWPSPKHNDVIVLYDNEDTLTISDCWVLCPYHEEISYHYKDYVCKDVDIPATVIKITKTKHTVRFQGNIILGGDVELEWDDMLLGVNNIVFDSWFENLTVLEIRENWGIDIVRSFEVKQKANEN